MRRTLAQAARSSRGRRHGQKDKKILLGETKPRERTSPPPPRDDGARGSHGRRSGSSRAQSGGRNERKIGAEEKPSGGVRHARGREVPGQTFIVAARSLGNERHGLRPDVGWPACLPPDNTLARRAGLRPALFAVVVVSPGTLGKRRESGSQTRLPLSVPSLYFFAGRADGAQAVGRGGQIRTGLSGDLTNVFK